MLDWTLVVANAGTKHATGSQSLVRHPLFIDVWINYITFFEYIHTWEKLKHKFVPYLCKILWTTWFKYCMVWWYYSLTRLRFKHTWFNFFFAFKPQLPLYLIHFRFLNTIRFTYHTDTNFLAMSGFTAWGWRGKISYFVKLLSVCFQFS